MYYGFLPFLFKFLFLCQSQLFSIFLFRSWESSLVQILIKVQFLVKLMMVLFEQMQGNEFFRTVKTREKERIVRSLLLHLLIHLKSLFLHRKFLPQILHIWHVFLCNIHHLLIIIKKRLIVLIKQHTAICDILLRE